MVIRWITFLGVLFGFELIRRVAIEITDQIGIASQYYFTRLQSDRPYTVEKLVTATGPLMGI